MNEPETYRCEQCGESTSDFLEASLCCLKVNDPPKIGARYRKDRKTYKPLRKTVQTKDIDPGKEVFYSAEYRNWVGRIIYGK